MEHRTPVEITPQTDLENRTPLTDGHVRELASSHLEGALDTDMISEKNYHIRSALQALVIAERTVSSD